MPPYRRFEVSFRLSKGAQPMVWTRFYVTELTDMQNHALAILAVHSEYPSARVLSTRAVSTRN